MFLQLKENYWVKLIGDPHLGKKFINGVPLNRRGERESQQMDRFYQELMGVTFKADPNTTSMVQDVIVMGDLFDQFHVSNEVLLQTYSSIRRAADNNPMVHYYILMGNHDVSRNTELVSSFQILKTMFSIIENISFITEIQSIGLLGHEEYLLMCPYEAFTPTKDLKIKTDRRYLAAFGHWDTQSFGDEHNLLPYEPLSKVTDLIVTGHEHNAREFMYDPQTKVIVTGSMLPYSHAEDPEGNIYVTVELHKFLQEPDQYHNKALRLLLKPGDELPENIDAMQVTFKFVTEDQEEEIQVELEDFSMKNVFDTVMRENEVPENTSALYWNKYQEKDSDAASA